jgi:hypothetical protein
MDDTPAIINPDLAPQDDLVCALRHDRDVGLEARKGAKLAMHSAICVPGD